MANSNLLHSIKSLNQRYLGKNVLIVTEGSHLHLFLFSLVPNARIFICSHLLQYQMIQISFVPICSSTKWSKFHLSPFALVPNGQNFICSHLLWYQMIKFSFVPICSSTRANENKFHLLRFGTK